MHEPVGVVEILVQILQFTPILSKFTSPPENEKCPELDREFKNEGPSLPPPPENEKCPELDRESENEGPSLPPQKKNCKRAHHTWRLNQYPRWVPSSYRL